MKMNNNQRIIFHADDYAACPEVSRHILDCKQKGTLDSISVLTNSCYYNECMQMLKPFSNSIKLNIHFNIAEGHCLSDPTDIPLLVNQNGMFCVSFFKILIMSLGSQKKELKNQLVCEFSKQLELLLPYIETIRIDSHQHYHMIPLVLDAILSVTQNTKKEIEFIRIPAEPLSPFFKHPSLYFTYKPINIVKNIVLNILNWFISPHLRLYRKKTSVFFGIIMSGHMDYPRVQALIPDFIRIANRKGMSLEILAHPGGVSNIEHLMDPHNLGCREFYMNGDRSVEKKLFYLSSK